MKESIMFFNENVHYNIRNKGKLRRWIRMLARTGQQNTGSINFVLCDDDFLLEINTKYLKHNTLTDIITFPFNDKKGQINGDIYISLPRIRENALKFSEKIEDELHRVMIHGILHLMGYNDLSKEEKGVMRVKENLWLKDLAENNY